MKKAIFYLLCLLLYHVPNVSAAKPQIANVAGTPQSGQILTIQGTKLLDENTSSWFMTLPESRCEGNSPSADGWDLMGGRYVSNVSLTGNKSMNFSISGPGGNNCPHSNRGDYAYLSHSTPVMYSRAYVRYSPNADQLFSAASYVKMALFQQTGVYVQPQAGSGWPSRMYVSNANSTQYFSFPKWTGNRWYCIEIMADNPNGRVTVWIDGTAIGTLNGSLSANPIYYVLGFINACPVPSGNFQMWTDSVAISSKRINPITMVEIGDEADYSAATKVKQALVHAADDRVEISTDLSGLGSGPYYMWITNNRQERSIAYHLGSIAYHLGGGNPPFPPDPDPQHDPSLDGGVIVFEDWEAGNFNNFDDDISVGQFSIQSSVVRNGSKALVNNLQAGAHGTGWMNNFFGDHPDKGGTQVEDITLDWSIYWSPGFQFPAGQKMFILASFESWSATYPPPLSYSPYYLTIAADVSGRYFLQLHSKTGGNVWQDFNQNQGSVLSAQKGTWTDFRVRLKLNTPGQLDGIAEMWINGNLKLKYTDVNFRDSYFNYGWNQLMISASATPDSPQNQSMYWDDIGLAETSGGNSTAPPSAPTGLRVVNQ